MQRISMATTITRRAKWQYPPAQATPRIIHLPRRLRRKAPKVTPSKLLQQPSLQKERNGKLESLFDQERSFTRGVVPVVLVSSRERVKEDQKREIDDSNDVVLVEEEKWRFQAELLRAECNLLRMEREIAVKKMERRRVVMERTLKSTIHTLLSGRKKICEGKNVSLVLEEQINNLMEKLEKLQKRSGSVKHSEVKKCGNFDKQACFLQRRLKKFGGICDEESCVEEIQEMAEASLSVKMSIEEDDESFISNRNSNETISHEARGCSGQCKAIIERIVEQFRAETEQWSHMQEMLGQVRDEMEELQTARDFWEHRALDSDYQIQSMESAVKEWRQKVASSEAKANELQSQISVVHEEIEKLRMEKERKMVRARNISSHHQESQNEMEKRVLVCHIKDNNHCLNDDKNEVLRLDGRRKPRTFTEGLLPRRSPLKEIGNMSSLMKQHGEGVLPLFCLHNEEMKRSF